MKIGVTQTVSASNQNYTFNNVTIPTSGSINIDVHFINDYDCNGSIILYSCNGDRNLSVNSVKIGNETISSSGKTADRGTSYAQATDGVSTYAYSLALYENSALRLSTTYTNCCTVAPATLIAEYHLNETAFNGTVNEINDTASYTGGPFHGQSTRISTNPYPSASTVSRARSGSPGTCGYASFSANNAIQLDNLPVSTTNGAKTSVSFWMYWNGTNSVMPIGWSQYDLWFTGTVFGFNTNASDVYGINTTTTPLANGWHHVFAVFTNGSVTSNKLYIDGVSKTLSQQTGSPNLTNAKVQSTLQISGYTASSSFRFSGGRIDEVKVYNGEVTQAQVDEAYNETYQCLGETVAQLAPVDNLALTANVTTSYVSPWENLEGVNDNVTPTTSYVYHLSESAGVKTYGNWANYGVTQWVSFDWPTDKELTSLQVFWWSDKFLGREILQPTTSYVEYWDGTSWQSLGNIDNELHTFNTLTINNIVTKKIRVSMSSAKATGITEVRIFGREKPSLVASYTMDETSWSGASGEVLDSSGNGYNATAKIKSGSTLPSTANLSRAYGTNSNGTCGYGVFTGTQYVDLPSTFPNLANGMTISAWIKTSDRTGTQRIFCDDQNNNGGYCLSLSDGDAGNGALKFFKRNSSGIDTNIKTAAIIQNNTWYFVAVSVDSGTSQATIYVYNQAGTLVASPTAGSMSNLNFTDSGTASIGGENLASPESAGFKGNIDEINVYSSALTQTEIEALRTTTRACPSYITNMNPSNFNCVVVGGSSDTGRLYTQLSNTGFNVDVVALKADRTTETSFVTTGTKNVTLEWMSNSNNSCTTGTAIAAPTTITFSTTDNGRKTVAIPAFNKAYKDLRCRVIDTNQTPNITGCSYDNFAVRPYQLALSTTNATADTSGTNTTATPVIKAGGNFNLTATAIKSATITDIDVGYDGTPTAHSTLNDTSSPKIVAHTGAVTKGTLSGSFSASVAGIATGNFTYDEVGYFKLNPYAFVDYSFTTVDQSGGDCLTGSSAYATTADASGKIGCYLYSPATNYFGRFTPDHFEISNISSPTQCGSFNYYGQEFPTSFKVTAKDHPSVNTTTQNYTGSFAKLGLTTWASGYNFSATGLPAGASFTSGATAPAGTWSSGVATITASHKIDRDNNSMLPATVSINAAPTDADNITTASTALVSNVPFKYGRIYYPNTFGSELLPLIVPIQVQYWNGLAYILNISDSCTNLSNTNFGMSNYKSNLSGSPICETRMTSVIKTSLGLYTAILSPPGWGNTGSVDLTLFTNNTAVGNTCVGITPTAATSRNYPWFGAPKAKRATFGIFKSPIIYMHENF